MQPVDRREARLARKNMAVAVNKKKKGYINPLVMRHMRGLTDGYLGHVKFVPIKESGIVVVLPAREGETGAEQVALSASQRAGWVNLYGALIDFPLQFTGNRKLPLPYSNLEMTDENGKPRLVGLLSVQIPQPKPGTARSKGTGQATPAQPAPAPASPAPPPEAQ